MKNLKCYVVTTDRASARPLFVSVDLDVKRSLAKAKAFVMGYNAINETGRTVIRRGNARLTWDRQKSLDLPSVG